MSSLRLLLSHRRPMPPIMTPAGYGLPRRRTGRWPGPPSTLSDALLFYSGQVARRAGHRLAVLRDGRGAPPSGQFDNAVTAAHVLAGLLRDLGTARVRVAAAPAARRHRAPDAPRRAARP
ncbi:MAG: hypothetical protein ACRDRV_18010 [Pseudonocardiaceae bacterium]